MSLQSLQLEYQQHIPSSRNAFVFIIQNREFILYKELNHLKVLNPSTNQSTIVSQNFDNVIFTVFVDHSNVAWLLGSTKDNDGFYASLSIVDHTIQPLKDLTTVSSLKKVERIFFIGKEFFVVGVSKTNEIYIVYPKGWNIYRLPFPNSIVSVKKIERANRQIHLFIECIDASNIQKIYIHKIDESDLIMNTYKVI
jgi:hypothetical protein